MFMIGLTLLHREQHVKTRKKSNNERKLDIGQHVNSNNALFKLEAQRIKQKNDVKEMVEKKCTQGEGFGLRFFEFRAENPNFLLVLGAVFAVRYGFLVHRTSIRARRWTRICTGTMRFYCTARQYFPFPTCFTW